MNKTKKSSCLDCDLNHRSLDCQSTENRGNLGSSLVEHYWAGNPKIPCRMWFKSQSRQLNYSAFIRILTSGYIGEKFVFVQVGLGPS
jgi:hypothetical protein